jgi:hypothetical protein
MKFWKKYHKWIGLVFSFFMIMFAWSGIVMNHRKVFSGTELPRSILPKDFRYENWNNASVKGSLKLSADSILLYGGAGVWLTDSLQTGFMRFTSGMKSGADNLTVSRIVHTASGDVFAATIFDLYKLDTNGAWENLTPVTGIDERIADMEVRGDSLVVLSRSHLFCAIAPYDVFERLELRAPSDYESKTGAFRTLWLLHSGELFGLGGKLFVDLLGVLLIIISVTGIIYFFCPSIIRRKNKRQKQVKGTVSTMKTSLRWHNRIGVWFLVFFFVLTFSGMFLRPPLLISVIRSKVPNIPGTLLNDPNPWRDKQRTIRYDKNQQEWLLYSSSGFYTFAYFGDTPEKVPFTPPVSVMGVTVLEPTQEGWMAGSFSGLFYWNRERGFVFDCYTGQPVMGRVAGRPVATNPISGYSGDFGSPVVFEYQAGARTFDAHTRMASMPDEVRKGKISLWNFALEVHTGRIYTGIIGAFADLYVFISGLLILLVLLSGYLLYRKRQKAKPKK